MRYQILPASPLHVGPLARRMGEEAKLIESVGGKPRGWLRWNMAQSDETWTAIVNGEVAAMWGVKGNELLCEGEVWAVFTDLARRYPLTIMRGAQAWIEKVMASRHALVSTVCGSDARARRFAQALGFDVAVHGPVLDKGILCYPIKLERKQGISGPPFIVFGLPRSRTAWLSRFLSYGGWTCHHDAAQTMRTFENVREFFRRPMIGAAETGACYGWRLLEYHFPEMKRVVVRRPVEEIVDSLSRIDIGQVGTWKPSELRRIFTYGARMLDQISARPGVLTVDFRDLETEDACRAVFEHCLPYRFDRQHWEGLRHVNVQCDFAAMLLHRISNRAEVDGFKAACGIELTRLVRSGLLARGA